MKSWLKQNWFKLGILVLIGATVATAAFVILKINREDDTLALQKYMPTQPATFTNPFAGQFDTTSTAPTTTNSVDSSSSSNDASPQAEPPEDSVLKIARCQSDAQIESNLEISRYKGDVVQDVLNCIETQGCDPQAFSSLLDSVEDGIQQTSYDNVYNLCLQVSENQFNNIEQTYDGYWTRCMADNPPATTATSSQAGTSGPSGMSAYTVQKSCVSYFTQTDGL
jgi:hypothetical protein